MITQADVRDWFDRTYREKGLSYLRPKEAYPIFLDLVGVSPGAKVLDVGCGPGLMLIEAVKRGAEAHGVDLSPVAVEMLPTLVPGASARVGNAEALPWPDETFDRVTCVGVMERIFDRARACAEMRRVTKRGGRLCVMVRNSHTLRWKLWSELLGQRNEKGHQDAAGLEEWNTFFRAQGFLIDDVLPDQWQRQKLRRALGISWERQRGMVARPILPLRFANEFIFLMRRGPDADAEAGR